MKSKNGARYSYNLNAGTVTNNDLYEEMEVPQGLGSRANLSCEKDMKLSNGEIKQGFCFVVLFCFQYCLKKIGTKRRAEVKVWHSRKACLWLIYHRNCWTVYPSEIISSGMLLRWWKYANYWLFCLWIKPAGMQEWKANISSPVWWGTYSKFLLLSHLSFNSYGVCSVCLLVCFSFFALLFFCRTIRTQQNCTLVRISPKKSELLQLKSWGAGEEKQTTSFPVLLGWHQIDSTVILPLFLLGFSSWEVVCAQEFSELAVFTLKSWPSCSIEQRWSGVPGAIFQMKDAFFVSQIYCSNVSAEDVSCSVVILINMPRETCKEAEAG